MFRNHYPKVELSFSSKFFQKKKRDEEIGGGEKEKKKKNHPEICRLKIQIPGPPPLGLLIHVG